MPRGYYIPFTKKQEAKIKKEYLAKPTKRLAKELNVTAPRILRFLKRNGLEIPRSIIEQRIKASRKKKGDIPFNKGLKQADYMSIENIEKSKKTRFKKGNKPHNTKLNGAISTRKDKSGISYKYIRISQGVWELYHRFIWEKENGKIPDKYIVAFKDGDTNNTCIENLELITITENMYRNSRCNFPREVIPTMVLSKQLETKINNLQNGE